MSKPGDLLQRAAERPQEQGDSALPLDQAARDAALDISGSWIVQAPAGAGKTELLTQRFLTLLAAVDEPEEILAITFTRAATAEMRGRILSAFDAAAHSIPTAGEPRTLQLARSALAQSINRGWQLLDQPHRLDVQTIDSLCLRLAHGQPLLSRLGGRLEPTEEAAPLYALAAQRTFAMLGHAPVELEAALRQLLLLRDNNLSDCRKLIAGMLEQREQWRPIFVLSEHTSVDWAQVRSQLEAPFAKEIQRVLAGLHAAFAAEPTLVDELLALARYACNNRSRRAIALLDGLQSLPPPEAEFLEHWSCLHHFLMTEGKWRKAFNKGDGFPIDGASAPKHDQRHFKRRIEQLMLRFSTHAAGEHLRRLLRSVPVLPAAAYTEPQWQTLRSVFQVLRHAVAELHVVFAERNQVDFPELSIAASTVLDDRENTRGLLALEAKRHLLIDEFQDTSRRQHQLIGRLLQEWHPGDGRTCFLVGDPMQSIYIFRQAEVELFGRVQRQGLDCGSHTHPCSGLKLSENFRSHAGLVAPLNRHFAAVFGEPAGRPGEVPFAPSTAAMPAVDGLDAVQVHPFFALGRNPDRTRLTRAEQVERIVALVAGELPRIEAAQAVGTGTYTVAILGRAKAHLAPVAAALRARGIPFRAVELETLADRQEILDLLSLLRALLHPMDRIAWLSVLRAPWCGLSLADLHTLTGADDRSFRSTPVPELISERAHLLSVDGGERLVRVAQVMTQARASSEHASSLAAWVERTWVSLGAPAYLRTEERENAETLFRLLDELAPHGIDVLNGSLDVALGRLCAAPDAQVSEHFGVQLMTIHKAKGLGFEVVIVPALERKPGGDGTPLITMLERVRYGARPDGVNDKDTESADEEQDEVLVAPLGGRGEQHRTYKWVQRKRRERESGERKRLFYVACTRARRQLHLIGTAEIASSGQIRPGDADSLLASAWPALAPLFHAARETGLREQAANAAEGAPVLVPAGQHTGRPAPGRLERLAAAGVLDSSALRLLRVPAGFEPRLLLENVAVTGTYTRAASSSFPQPSSQPSPDRPYDWELQHSPRERPEGSFEQRARGNAVHAMLELVSERWALDGRAGEPSALELPLARLARMTLRRAGLSSERVDAMSGPLVAIVLAVATHSEGRWILSPHPDAQSEWSFSGWTPSADSRLRTLRVDRAFRAGDCPLSHGRRCLWVIDYKTGASPGGIALEAYIEAQKEQWRPQLEDYGNALRAFHRDRLELRYGLYFPELLRLKCWSG